jgi:hypothetical protein
MKKSTWRKFVQDVYHQEIASKLRHSARRWHPEKIEYRYEQLFRASRTVRYIEDIGTEDTDVSTVLTREHLKSTLEEIRGAHRQFNEHVIRDSGIVDVLEVHMIDILSELQVSDLPPEDIEALRRAGSTDPEAELRVRIRRIRTHFSRVERRYQHMSLSSCITEATQQLDQKIEALDEKKSNPLRMSADLPDPQVKKKWFKGIGSIARGTVLTGVDISLLAGWWAVPLSPDTTIVGGIASIVTGLGDIAIGVGELRGE